ncbi:Allophanate hydrolase [Lachnellula occidentalis]|uniref:Allophanate hydrolase n=1 Tax=Lachnellula occidentalis TaxID=215460 RepID=A0A8H8S825_9HELO|nr:Allophanate hydrolase [Lachnellula occidentalis]
MVLQLSDAAPEDVDRIASVHLSAFDSNFLLHAQFPTPASLAFLHSILCQELLHAIQNAQTAGKAVVIVRDTEAENQIIGFAKWDLPGVSNKGNQAGVTWHKDVRQELLDVYHEKAERAKVRVVGDKPCYRLTFVGTHPDFQGKGAATLLTKWGLERAKKDNVPVYLESTISASSLYRRLGFMSLDGLSMALPSTGRDSGPNIYEELCMLRTWKDIDGMEYWDSSLEISSLRLDYEAGMKPQTVVQAIYDRIEAYREVQPSLWIHLQPMGEVMSHAHALNQRWPIPEERPPLWGVPFSVKDSIDVVGIPTTIGCPALAFTPTSSATVYQQCIDAGGLFIGKPNMEQLATGMTGCRSPYGTLHSTFSKQHIVGGSSSGSAVTVSQGLVSFSLGSDTAGSIRVPALYNGVFGFKPTKGTVSARGVFPACQHQDCVSFLATSVGDAESVWDVCKGFDKMDAFSKPSSSLPEPWTQSSNQLSFCFGVPPDAALDACSPLYRQKFDQVVQALKTESGNPVDLDWTPFASANELLYDGTFVLERLTILPQGWFEENKQLLHPVTRSVFEGALARGSTAVDVFRDLHKQAQYKRAVEDILTFNEDGLTVMVVPTAPFHPTIEEVKKDPLGINGRLGVFAHFANVLDLVGIAVKCGTYEIDGENGEKTTLPFGVTILAGCGLDKQLLTLAKQLEESLSYLGEE